MDYVSGCVLLWNICIFGSMDVYICFLKLFVKVLIKYWRNKILFGVFFLCVFVLLICGVLLLLKIYKINIKWKKIFIGCYLLLYNGMVYYRMNIFVVE